MAFGFKSAVSILVVALVAWRAHQLYEFLGYNKQVAFNDGDCTLLGIEGLHGSEDFARWRDGIVFVSAGDLHHAFHEGARARPGGIAAFNITLATPAVKRVTMTGFPGARFQPHGIFVSNTTDLLYAVNHAGEYSGVEVFRIASGQGAPTLAHVRTIRSQSWPFYGVNDVVEGAGRGEVYVTQWLPFGFPKAGKHAPQSTADRLINLSELPAVFSGAPLTRVHRCVWTDDASLPAACEDVTGMAFTGANGITISEDRTTLYVNDPPAARVSVYRRDPETGGLGFVESFSTVYPVDNIDYTAGSGDIVMGSLPLPHHCVTNSKLPLDKWVPVPGGMMIARRQRGGGWELEEALIHDGTRLNQISAAVHSGGRVFIGSPFNDGVLMCRVGAK